jgi:hypothetical protein
MKKIIFAIVLVMAVSFLDYYKPESGQTQAKETDLVVHEWGTFTSIAGKNGFALDWRPLNGPSDLPTFVYNEASKDGFRGTYHYGGKGEISQVRMETPVIYFYTKKEQEIEVSVDFPKGKITEWYPQAGIVNDKYSPDESGRFHSGITWGKIKLMPNEKENFLREAAYSHYYPARETDAVPLQVCNADKTKIEHEKFLFYRGIGNFDLPLNVKLDGGKVVLGLNGPVYSTKGNPGRNLQNLIVFENRGGQIGYTYVEQVSDTTTVERPQLNKTRDQIYADLERILILNGLYQKEAKAMIKTWADSWFEEGLRVFYILPRLTTDEILPLRTDVPRKETVRVLVGRTEVITPEMEQDVKRQVALLGSTSEKVRAEASANLKSRGRFYEPILKSILQDEKDAAMRKRLEQLIAAAGN